MSGLPANGRRHSSRRARLFKTAIYAIALASAALYVAASTYILLSQVSQTSSPEFSFSLLAANVLFAVVLAVLIGWRVVRLLIDRRHGMAGAQLHIRLVTFFALAATVPVFFVASFSWVSLKSGLEQWFGERTEQAVESTRDLARVYVEERAREMQQAILLTATDLTRVQVMFERSRILFNRYLVSQSSLRLFDALYLIDGAGTILAKIELADGDYALPPATSFQSADAGDVVIGFNTPQFNERTELIRATYALDGYGDGYLVAYTLLSPEIIAQLRQTKVISDDFRLAEERRARLESVFAAGYAALAVVVLFGAIWLGLWAATSIVAPIGRLVVAAGRVSDGDLTARVDVEKGDGELGVLARAFNRMTAQLHAQRDDLIEANRQFDERRRFTETVLAGVSAGVVGLSADGRITIANRSAQALLDVPEKDLIGRELADVASEFTQVVRDAVESEEKFAGAQIDIERRHTVRNLNVRVARDERTDDMSNYVVTFDDITNLVSAQRTAAWSDIARRIAHEIKNPLTPIQLSAERLRRKYAKEITSNPEVFAKCTETIIRQVNDIGRMVDEFSSFARMPSAVMSNNDICEVARSAVFPQRVANPDIEFRVEIPDYPVTVRCDARLVVQALTNIIMNATESVDARMAGDSREGRDAPGVISLTLTADKRRTQIIVSDNGVGLPKSERHRLTEPYVTTREKGTGLGLAIVKKVMEEHGGALALDDCHELGPTGASVKMTLPVESFDVAMNDDEKDAQTGTIEKAV